MEFLKSCQTNAQAIGEFEAVAFQTFSVARKTPSIPRPHDWHPSDDIRDAEAELRQARHLVLADPSRSWVWFFRATTVDQVNQQPLELPILEGFNFHREQHGVFKASELARPPMRGANAAATGSTSSPLAQGLPKGMPGGSSRVSGSSQPGATSDQAHQFDSPVIYEAFTSSVVALISYHLVKDHAVVALNYRTFASKPAIQHDHDAMGPNTLTNPHWLTNVDVSWTSSGTLIVSTFSLAKHDLQSLDEITTDAEQKSLVGKCVRVAPGGMLAQVASFDEPVDAASADVTQKLQRKKARMLEQLLERWKNNVERWLGRKGYALSGLEKRDSWVRIRTSPGNQTTQPSSAPFASSGELLWPRALCFCYRVSTESHARPASEPTTRQEEKALQWFETVVSTGFKDPVDAAQQWFVGKLERDKITEARRRAKKAEEDAARLKEESGGLFPSSPLNVRAGTYGDLQSVSGVYPTPPDGILPGTAISSGDTPSVSGMTTNVILAPGVTNPAINISAPQETILADGQSLQPPPTSPAFPVPFDQYNADGDNDDLFEDMEEDEYEGNGVTEDDFNFFDGPDGEDEVMMDAPNNEDTKKAENEDSSGRVAPSKVKEEIPDQMTALENALTDAANETPNGTQVPKVEEPVHASKAEGPSKTGPKNGLLIHSLARVTSPAQREPTPPLSPIFIEKALLPSPNQNRVHRDSVFDPLNFDRKMSLSDAKYQDGRFSFPNTEAILPEEDKSASRPPKSLRNLPLLTRLRYAIGVASANGSTDITPLADAESDMSDTTSESSSELDDDEDEIVSIAPTSCPTGLILPMKRKLPASGNATPLSATSFAESLGGDFPDTAGLQFDAAALSSLEPTPADWALIDAPAPAEVSLASTRYAIPAFSPILPHSLDTPTSQPDLHTEPMEDRSLSAKDNIAVAQIVTDQIVSANLDLLLEDSVPGNDLTFGRTPTEDKWHNTIRDMFSKATNCSVAALASVHDVFPDTVTQTKGQQRPPPRKPNELPVALGHQINRISPPHIRVRRADVQWDLLPPALPFWEALGLAPCSPVKNVVPFCVYPHSTSIRPCVENLMVNVQLAYENCRLGNHARVETLQEYQGGLIPYGIDTPTSTRAAWKALRDTCCQLGKLLAMKHAQMRDKVDANIDAFVIYMIDPFERSSAIWQLCSAFWAMFQAYGQGPQGRQDQIQKPDLVLQIVPIKYVASFEVPVILDAGTYTSFAREVYDRCPPSAPSEDKTPLSIYTAPSFQLEEPIPRAVPFKLNAEPPQDLLHENSYIHLGYSISLDGTWVTAAWTDVCGKSQAVVSYYLGTRMFGEVAKEIWQTTIEILQARRVTWRVCIARCGVMDREEMEAWVFLVSCPTQLNLFITLLAVDTNPSLKFTPTMASANTSNPSTAGNPSASTPGSTPQAGVSPDHGLTPAATPSADATADPTADLDARLVDVTDDSWGVVLAHRLNNSNSTNEFRPALISGLLVKRGLNTTSISTPNTPDPQHGLVVVAVNILWMGAVNPTRAATSPFPPSAAGTEGVSPGGAGVQPNPNPQERSYSSLTWTPTLQTRAAAENLLKEVLGQFRGLGLLARLKGMRGSRHGTVPWHVAAAVRGVKGLGMCLPR